MLLLETKPHHIYHVISNDAQAIIYIYNISPILMYEILAASSEFLTLEINSIQEITIEDFPLFIHFPVKSLNFTQLLKDGTLLEAENLHTYSIIEKNRKNFKFL
jgi:hypothetical protein